MKFSPRLRQVLLILLRQNQVVQIQMLADEIKVSKRTIQRELENVDSLLKDYHLSLESKAGIGIWLSGSPEDKTILLDILQEEDVIDSADIEERRNLLILEILKDFSPKKLYYYANIFCVSEATICTDLDAIEDWFKQFNLKIIRKPGYGVTFEGSEINYRNALLKFINDNMDEKLLNELTDEQDWTGFEVIANREGNSIFTLLEGDVLRRAVLCLLSIRDKRLSRLTVNSYIGLILYITIAISRILQQEIIEPNDELVAKLKNDEDYDLALYIAGSIEGEFQIELPDVEVAYILLHIKGSKLQYIDEKDVDAIAEREQLLSFIDLMIDTYDEKLAYKLKQDDEFIVGLLAHLKPTLIRLKNNMTISNPLLSQIKLDYPRIFQKCKILGELIEKKLNCIVPESEIGFLAMHFGAAIARLESQKEIKRRVNIGIVCASGIGISRLMFSKLNRFLKDRAEITTYGVENLDPLVLEKLDFLVTSIHLDGIKADILRVSPLLLEEDLIKIDSKVRMYAGTPRREPANINFSRQLESIYYVIDQIKNLIKNFNFFEVNNNITFDELLVAVSERLSTNIDKSIQIQKDIKKREKIASQVIPEYDFVLLHAKTKGVKKPSFSICLTKDHKEFTDPYLRSIHIIIVMLIPDDDHLKENAEILGYLSSRLVDDNKFLNIIYTGNKDKIQNFISIELEKYFNQFLGSFN